MARTRRSAPPARAPGVPVVPVGLAVRLLGGFAVLVGGRPVERVAWRVLKAQAVIKLLALAPGRQLAREQLLDLLWPDLEPDASVNNLHRTLHAARRALAPGGDLGVLPLRKGVLVLDFPGGVRVDIDDFEVAAAAARRTRDADDYQTAIALYAGDLLPEDRYEDWAAPRREALRQAYLGLLAEAARLHMAAGDYRSAIDALSRAVAHEPTQEEAHAGLMRAYALAGRRAEALRQFARLRETLDRELDATPEPATQALYGAILARRFPPPHAEPRPAAPSPSPAARLNLPAPLTSFVGRGRELATLQALLPTTRLLTLIGPPGSGKTRLALELARHGAASRVHQDGIWLVELATVADAALVPAAVAAALGVVARPERALAATLGDYLRTRALLLVLDNCEHLASACGELAMRLLAVSPGLRVLATSRAALRVPGELTWRVPPLALPSHDAGDLADVAASEAARLLLDRVRWRVPDFTLDAGNAAAVAAICLRLDGLPLALELAAPRLPALAMGQLAGRLDDALRALADGGPAAPPRQRTLRATLDWSHELLAGDERLLFRRLGVFAGGWTLDAAERICADGALHAATVLDTLARLVDQSLVVAEPTTEGARYRLLEVVRQYAQEQLAASAEIRALQERHATYFRALAEEGEQHLAAGEQVRWLERLEAEHGNLRAALAWALEGARADDARRVTCGATLATALTSLWLLRGHLAEGRAWLGAVLAHDRFLSADVQARVLVACGVLASNWGDRARAATWLEASLPLWRASRDRRGHAGALRHLASIRLPQGDLAGARSLLAECIALSREAGDRHGEALAVGLLARAELAAGDYGAAESLGEASLMVLRELRDDANGALVVTTLGTSALYRGDSARAAELFSAGLTLHRRLGSAWGEADSLAFLGWSVLFQGDLERAAALCEESARRCQAIGDRGIHAAALTGQGLALLFAGDHGRAGALLADALTLWRDQGNDELVGYCLVGLAGVEGLRGQGARAALLLGAAEALRQRTGVPLRPVAEASYARIAGLARAGCDAATFSAAWARGRVLTQAAAVAAALVSGGVGPAQARGT